MIIDCIADLHGHYPELEGGDLLIVAGDLTAHDLLEEHEQFCFWLHKQPYKSKVVLAGNHDNLLKKDPYRFDTFITGVSYLEDSGALFEWEKRKIWGTPWSAWFHGVHPSCKAFMIKEKQLAKKWALIPDDTEILITHTPPFGILDAVTRGTSLPELGIQLNTFHLGSPSLRERIEQLPNLKLHVFGHIHENGGQQVVLKSQMKDSSRSVICVNASIMNEHYKPVNKSVRIIL